MFLNIYPFMAVILLMSCVHGFQNFAPEAGIGATLRLVALIQRTATQTPLTHY